MTYVTVKGCTGIAATQTELVREVGSLFGERLRDAVLGMHDGESRVGEMGWYFNDIARHRKINPLGLYPAAAKACIEKGRKFSSVAAPLYETLAMLRSLCNQKGAPLTDALLTEAREEGEKNIAEQELSFCISNPSRSTLERYVKEASEYRDALDAAITSAENVLYRSTK